MADVNRRKFFGLAGASAVAAPVAAKQLAAGAFSGLAPPPPPMPPQYGLADLMVRLVSRAPPQANVITRAAIKAMGVPDWLREQWRQQAREAAVVYIDSDIEARPYMSRPVKIAMQRVRNEQRLEEEFFSSGHEALHNRMRAWLDKHGADWVEGL